MPLSGNWNQGTGSELSSEQNSAATQTKHKQGCLKRYGKTILRYAFSHVGLCFLLAGYCAIGAAVFIAVEKGTEHEKTEEVREALTFVKNLTANLSIALKAMRVEDLTIEHYYNLTELYQAYLMDEAENGSYLGHNVDYEQQWVFSSAILYSVSIITLIGYGHINVVTRLGQILVIPFSLLGIPLMLMFLTNIGEVLAKAIRWTYSKVSCYEQRMRKKIQNAEAQGIDLDDVYDLPKGAVQKIKAKNGERGLEKSPIKIHVPIWLTSIILLSYILLGSLIFKFWEGWPFITATYFCIVSFTTTGFGDFVPGWSTLDTWTGQAKLAISALYIVTGLAFLSMGFNLMIEEILIWVKNVAKKSGFHKEHDENKKIKSNLDNFVKRKAVKMNN